MSRVLKTKTVFRQIHKACLSHIIRHLYEQKILCIFKLHISRRMLIEQEQNVYDSTHGSLYGKHFAKSYKGLQYFIVGKTSTP